MKYIIQWVNGNPHIEFFGDISWEEINQASNILLGDVRFDSMDYVILNFLNVNKLTLSKNDIKLLSVLDRSASRWNQNLNIALLTKDEVAMQRALEYIGFLQCINWEIKIFDSIDRAIIWCLAKVN